MSTVFNRPDFTPPLPMSDAIQFIGASGYQYTLAFGAPVKDPVLHLGSLASTLTFPPGTTITRVSGDAEFGVSGNTVIGGLDAPTDDANGTVRLTGTFTSIPFTTTFAGSDGIFIQAGRPRPVAPPGGGAGATPPPSGGGTAPPPFIKALGRVGVRGSARVAAVRADISNPYTKVFWSVNGKPAITGRSGHDTLLLRLRPASMEVAARAVGPGGSSTVSRFRLPGAPAPRGATAGRIARKTEKSPIYVTGRRPSGFFDLDGGGFCARTGPPARLSAQNGLLDIQGRCLRKISSLSDIPEAERGVVVDMAKRYGIALRAGVVNLGLDLSDAYVTSQPVRVNGVDLTPRGNGAVVIFPQARAVATSNAQMSVGALRLGNPRRFEIDTREVNGGIRLPTVPVVNGSDVLKAFRFFGDVDITATREGARINAGMDLPSFLNAAGGPSSARVSMRADTDRGLILDSLHVGPIGTFIGPVYISDFKLDYVGGAEQRWTGQGRACLPIGGCIDMVPPDGGVRIVDGKLDYIGASHRLIPPVPLFPGLDLDKIGFGFGLGPTRILANPVELRVLRLVKVDGRMVVAWPTAGESYQLERDSAQLEPDPGRRRFPPQFYGVKRTAWTVAMSGGVSVAVPVFGDLHFGGGYLLYEHPGYLAFGGGVDEDFLGVATITGGVSGEVNTGSGRFDVHGGVKTCFAICYGGDVHFSSRGASICARPPVIPDFGVGVYWPARVPQDWRIMFPGCRWSPFREVNIRGASVRSAQTGPLHSFTLSRGDPGRTVRLLSASGAPRARIVGPGGRVLDSPAGDGPAAAGGLMAVRLAKIRQTAVGVVRPSPGTYRVEALPGSPPITSVAVSKALPPARIRARVGGRGSRRVLTYRVRPRAGQRLTFLDRTAGGALRAIGTAKGASGRLRFSPAPGLGRHQVVAQFELDGLPAERRTVARFTPPAARLGRTHGLRLRHRGARLRISWRRVREARAYEVVVTPSGSRQRRIRTRRRTLSIRLPKTNSGRVTVRAVDPQRQGRIARKRFRATAKHKGFKRLPRAPRLRR